MSSASAQKCGGVQKKTMRKRKSAGSVRFPVAAAQPTTGGTAPAAPPITMFCGVERAADDRERGREHVYEACEDDERESEQREPELERPGGRDAARGDRALL